MTKRKVKKEKPKREKPLKIEGDIFEVLKVAVEEKEKKGKKPSKGK